MKERGLTLCEARATITTGRTDQYGAPEDSFPDIAFLWNWWLNGRTEITPVDVAMMQALMKLARHKHQAKRDNLVDSCGYLAIVADLEELARGEDV